MDISFIIYWTIFLIAVVVVLGTFAYGAISAAPWVPLWKKDVRRMLQLAEVKENELVYDLGAGDGRIIIMAAQEFNARGVGFEFAVLPYFFATCILYMRGIRAKARMRYADFFRADLRDADVITVFLTPAAMEKLKPKFEKELKPGARVVSYAFHIPGWEPTKKDKPNEKSTTIYMYQR